MNSIDKYTDHIVVVVLIILLTLAITMIMLACIGIGKNMQSKSPDPAEVACLKHSVCPNEGMTRTYIKDLSICACLTEARKKE